MRGTSDIDKKNYPFSVATRTDGGHFVRDQRTLTNVGDQPNVQAAIADAEKRNDEFWATNARPEAVAA